jgi:hypothetical protein
MVAQMCLVALVLEMSVGDKTSIIDCGEACDGSAAGRLDRERRENSNKALSSLVNFSNQQSFKFYQVEVEQFWRSQILRFSRDRLDLLWDLAKTMSDKNVKVELKLNGVDGIGDSGWN